jgi:serine/threonine-protein kinase
MGEVYRADDLTLGHTVALKFLPKDLASDPKRLEYFHADVRLTRQVSHPNVCRVYDIGEVDGQHFLSMEYIDGEDLSVLLRRIGRLPAGKGVQISQQLCAGLAAAHGRGVLHRDLKPANIMIDGQGQVRITDFGLARLANAGVSGEVVGTPAYMAPEQLSRGEATIQSDLYSLGLILYELFTGEAVYKKRSIADRREAEEHSSLTKPSEVIADMDPVVERAILRCLEIDPVDRPVSARAVATSLPGDDLLAAALAAGETPSPEMVAASGTDTVLQPVVGAGLLAGIMIGLLFIAWVAGPRRFSSKYGAVKRPAILVDVAQRLIREDLGYADEPNSYAFDFANSQPGELELQFWYRQRIESTLAHQSFYNEYGDDSYGRPTFQVPSWQVPGELGLKLTADGRLLFLRALPPLEVSQADDASDADSLPWAKWFRKESTGFMLAESEQVSSDPGADADSAILTVVSGKTRTTPDASDAVRIWHGVDHRIGDEVYVVAAAFRGRPIYYEVLTKDEFESSDSGITRFGMVNRSANQERWRFLFIVAFVNTLLIVAAVLALINVRKGRVDRRGAFRVALYVFCVMTIATLGLGWHITLSTPWFPLLANCVFEAALVWLMYVALEPLVRRLWPQMLVAWSRLVGGRIHDPAVGLSLLVGVFAGVLLEANGSLAYFIADSLGASPVAIVRSQAYVLSGIKEIVGFICASQIGFVFRSTLLLLILLLARLILRREGWAFIVAGFILLFIAAPARDSAPNVLWAWYAVVVGVTVGLTVLVRFGFLATAITMFTQHLASKAPLTLNTDQWYFDNGLLVMAFLLFVAGYGCYISLGGRSFLQRLIG